MAALQDVNEIKVLGLMLLLRLGQLAPTTVVPRLDDAAEPLKVIMKDVEVKDDTVKQDLERKGACDFTESCKACSREHPLMGRRRGDAAFGTPDGGATLQDVDAAAGSGVPSFRWGSARLAAVEGL
jgi:cullin-associated NEDD8-dissociated protein 1